MSKETNKPTPYDVITDRIVGLLAKGTVPWRKPWSSEAPRSLVSDKTYRGVNVFLLEASGFSSPYWITYKQAQERKGYVKEGERGWPVVFWRWIEREDPKTKKPERIPFLRYYTVFNAKEQCENLAVPETERSNAFSPIEECERVVKAYPNPPKINIGSAQAFYRPSTDSVHVPSGEKYSKPEEYYSTVFHELIHSTGNQSRLARKGISDGSLTFGSHGYCKEELVAEMGAAFLCGICGIEPATIENSAAYIKGWLRSLKDDPRMVVQAAAQAQKAADWIRNVKQETAEEETTPEELERAA